MFGEVDDTLLASDQQSQTHNTLLILSRPGCESKRSIQNVLP